MSGLTARQQDVLRFIIAFQEAKGFSPCFREIAEGVGLRAKSRVAAHLDDLEQRGAIRRLTCRERSIEVLQPIAIPRAPDGAPLFVIPMAGTSMQGDHSW